MHLEDRLPQNPKEGILFMLIISILSVNTIAPIIVGMERGFSVAHYVDTLKIIPFAWIALIVLIRFIVKPLAGILFNRLAGQTDGFNARILLNIVLNVSMISFVMTIIGPWIGMGEINFGTLEHFFPTWFRNFGIAFWVELLFAQPIARAVMKSIHTRKRLKTA
ncbi:putative membrane protein [Exiguobacterium sp. S17]|nr:putative membrane protein [Exiguobacterium sp. S17]